jgi:hypothetical protein
MHDGELFFRKLPSDTVAGLVIAAMVVVEGDRSIEVALCRGIEVALCRGSTCITFRADDFLGSLTSTDAGRTS